MEKRDFNLLGNNIRELRNRNKLSQSELSKLMHVSQQTVGSWETGRAIPGSDTLDKLADYFDVTTDFLLGRKAKKDSEVDLDEMLDNAHSFNGKPLDDHDRKVIRGILKAFLEK